ncbi:Oxidoreductase boa17 [Aspergillus melleus]|uniref:Oxidoreductase boa17 n=1 Tax=Aspergillus melleus TaxID=138277 RepID=A0ACC3AUV2_9EURO|nr:Oxidoreductase boa17 [Aspergillus melleus]
MPRVWFITGSSRGLGRSIAEAALESGDAIIATARSPEQIADLTERYGDERVLTLPLDVTDNERVIQAVHAGHLKFGRIDIVDTNFFGVVYVSKAVLPILRLQGSGHIFQVSSLGGRIGAPGLSAYQSAKWAVGGFSTVLAQGLAPFGVKVTVLEPGGIRTDWAGSSMTIPQVSEPYQATVGTLAEHLRKSSGSEPSLPGRIADIIMKIAALEEEPPLRLLVGPDAVEYAGQAAEALAASDEEWRDVSLASI